MALDPSRYACVACATIFACTPVQTGPMPPNEPSSIPRTVGKAPPASTGRHVMVGEMCPTGAGGRPAIAPLVMHGVQWIDAPAEVEATVERGATPRFVVFGVDGKTAGVFDTVGLADIGNSQSVATGAYVGGAPCSTDAGGGNRVDDAKCVTAFGGCGLALGELARPDDAPETPTFATGEACLAGDTIVVDIDGDKVNEAFPIAQALDGIRGPAAEWSASPTAAAPCKGSFQLYGLKLDAPVGRTGKQDPAGNVTIDLAGVVDLDGDGRKELILAMSFATVRSYVVYSASQSPQRLELVGEGTTFPRQ